jgi:hypothetical protein
MPSLARSWLTAAPIEELAKARAMVETIVALKSMMVLLEVVLLVYACGLEGWWR